MNQPADLSLEQEFHLRLFADQVQMLSPEQAKELLVEFNRRMMIKDNLYRELLKPYWELGPAPRSDRGLTSGRFASEI